MIKLFSLLIPVVLIVVFSIVSELIVKSFGKTWPTYALLPTLGLLFSFITYLGFKKLSILQTIRPMKIGTPRGLASGVALGVIVSCLSAYLFYLTKSPSVDLSLVWKDLHLRLIGNIFPASVEEVTFRGGLVHYLFSYWGKNIGLLGGSLPFGIIHLVGRFFGNPVDLAHVIGVSVAGFSLSLLYLEYGLLPAIGFHLVWNSLCSQWVSVFSIPRKGGVQMIEGHWTTSLVLILLIVLILSLKQFFVKNR
ncbi:MAG: CPBP family intramembrane metalloprotease [Bacteriovoracaceae bacterium]|jgi:membrane protease YdiL (CAAX protease family)|nr:CPBP family intramembrane metalloprotease [Bacteriovoracaceae bacterium]